MLRECPRCFCACMCEGFWLGLSARLASEPHKRHMRKGFLDLLGEKIPRLSAPSTNLLRKQARAMSGRLGSTLRQTGLAQKKGGREHSAAKGLRSGALGSARKRAAQGTHTEGLSGRGIRLGLDFFWGGCVIFGCCGATKW